MSSLLIGGAGQSAGRAEDNTALLADRASENSSLLAEQPEEQPSVLSSELPRGEGVRFALAAIPDLTAQNAARMSQLAQSLNLPENVVFTNPYMADLEATTRRMEQNSAVTNSWALMSRVNAAMARDDAGLDGAMSHASRFGREWQALKDAYSRGVWHVDSSDQGNLMLDAIARGDTEGAARYFEEGTRIQRETNPRWEQEMFGLLFPGNVDAAQSLRERPDRGFEPIPGLQDGPLDQHLADIFSADPYVIELRDGRAVLVPSLGDDRRPLTREQAAERFMEDGQHAGVFASEDHAMYFLSRTPEERRRIADGWQPEPDDTWAMAALGPGHAAEQLHRMITRQWPTSAFYGGIGAIGGGLIGGKIGGKAGSIVPGKGNVVGAAAGTVAGAGTGLKTGWAVGAGWSAFRSERGSFALDLRGAKDALGNGLPDDVITLASNAYGALAGITEMAGEAVLLSMLRPLGYTGACTKAGIRSFFKSAIKRAAFDRMAGKEALDVIFRMGIVGLAEGMEEGIQESLQLGIQHLAQLHTNRFHGGQFHEELFTRENLDQIVGASGVGFAAGLWLGGGPVVISSAYDVRSGRMARAYQEGHLALYDMVEKASTRQLSPAHMQSALEHAHPALREHTAIPADAALEYYQSGIDILTPLGITEEQAQKAAAQGQDIHVPVSRLHANLDRTQMEAAANIMRSTPDALNVAEAARLDQRVAQDAAKVIELFQSQTAELEALDKMREELRQETIETIRKNPALVAQAKAANVSAEQFVDNHIALWERFALRMLASAGQSPVETFQRIFFGEKRQGEARAAFDPVGAFYDEVLGHDAQQEAQALKELEQEWKNSPDNPINHLRGRIDGKSLKKDWPDAYREIVKNHTPNFFRSKERGGLPVDYLISDMENAGLVPHGATADDIVTMLRRPKGERDSRRMAGATLFQTIPDAVGGITPEVAARIGIRPGALILREGALQHIEQEHGDQIRQLGFSDAQTFINHILSHVDAVYKGDSGRIFEFVTRDTNPQSRVMARLEFELSGDKYEVKTAGPVRKGQYKKRTPLWDRSHAHPLAEANPMKVSHRGSPGQSGEHLDLTAPVREVNHAVDGRKLGSIKPYPEGYLVSLFKGANLSTLLHETGHIFFEEMTRFVEAGVADQAMVRDYETLRNWLGARSGEALSVEQKEKIARGFEAYLMEGKAPTEDLKGAFSRFRRWLLKIYREAVNLDVQLTDEVRGVFDRMLATEQEIADTAARHELLDLTSSELDAMQFTGTARETVAGLGTKGREEAAESLSNERNHDRMERLARFHKEANEELRTDHVQTVRATMRKTPLDLTRVREEYGNEAAERLMAKNPGCFVTKEVGVDPEVFAESMGFESGADMVAQLLDAPSRSEFVQQRVQEKEARHDANFDALDHLMDTSAQATQRYILERKLSEIVGVEPIERQAYSLAAQRELAAMPIGRARQTGNFLAAISRQTRKFRDALASGDMRGALEAHRKASLNIEFAKESRKIAREFDKVEAYAKRLRKMKPGVVPDANRAAINHVLDTYGLAPRRGSEPSQSVDLRATVEQALGDDVLEFMVFFQNWVLDGQNPNAGERDQHRLPVYGFALESRDFFMESRKV